MSGAGPPPASGRPGGRWSLPGRGPVHGAGRRGLAARRARPGGGRTGRSSPGPDLVREGDPAARRRRGRAPLHPLRGRLPGGGGGLGPAPPPRLPHPEGLPGPPLPGRRDPRRRTARAPASTWSATFDPNDPGHRPAARRRARQDDAAVRRRGWPATPTGSTTRPTERAGRSDRRRHGTAGQAAAAQPAGPGLHLVPGPLDVDRRCTARPRPPGARPPTRRSPGGSRPTTPGARPAAVVEQGDERRVVEADRHHVGLGPGGQHPEVGTAEGHDRRPGWRGRGRPRPGGRRRPPRGVRASMAARRISSHRSRSLLEAGPSVPRPTRMPRARRSASGAIPEASLALLWGQWATATSWVAVDGRCPPADSQMLWAASTRPSNTPAPASTVGNRSAVLGGEPVPLLARSRPGGCGTGRPAPGRRRRCRPAPGSGHRVGGVGGEADLDAAVLAVAAGVEVDDPLDAPLPPPVVRRRARAAGGHPG